MIYVVSYIGNKFGFLLSEHLLRGHIFYRYNQLVKF